MVKLQEIVLLSAMGISSLTGCMGIRDRYIEPTQLTEVIAGRENPTEFPDNKQKLDTDCSVMNLYNLLFDVHGEEKICYKQLYDKVYDLKKFPEHKDGMIYARNFIKIFNDLPYKVRDGWEMKVKDNADFDDIIEKLNKNDMPVLVPYMVDVSDWKIQLPVNGFFSLLNITPWTKYITHLFTDGDDYLLSEYPHVAPILTIYENPIIDKDPNNDRIVVLMDTWKGKTGISPVSPGLDPIPEDVFMRKWSTFYNHGMCVIWPNAVEYSKFKRLEFEKHAKPRSLFYFEKQ